MLVVEADGERVTAQYFVPQQVEGVAFVLHGYFDHVGLFAHVIEPLLARDLAVVCFDQIGHGLSGGARHTIDSFDTYIRATAIVYRQARSDLADLDSGPWHWVGQSMGGGLVLEALQGQLAADGVGEVILLAPLTLPYGWWLNQWVYRVARTGIKERPRRITENAENQEFLALQHADPLRALTLPIGWVDAMVQWHGRFAKYPASELAPKVLQGDADRTVDARYMRRLYAQRYPHAEHFLVAGGRHHLANESEARRQQMWHWLDARCRWRI